MLQRSIKDDQIYLDLFSEVRLTLTVPAGFLSKVFKVFCAVRLYVGASIKEFRLNVVKTLVESFQHFWTWFGWCGLKSFQRSISLKSGSGFCLRFRLCWFV